jgi:hypothetical protein
MLPPAGGWPVRYLMQTGGPVNLEYDDDTVRPMIMQAFLDAYDNIEKIEIAVEVGKNGYRHFHSIMKFKKERKPQAKPKLLMMKRGILKEQGINEKGDPAKPNMGSHSVYKEHSSQAWDIFHKYLNNPTKRKATDDGILYFEDTTPTPEEMYQKIFKHPVGSRERDLATAEYHAYMLGLLRYGAKGVVLN